MKPYVPLHLQSHFSLLHGTVSIECLVERLAGAGCDRAALVDRNNLYGAMFFQTAARAAGIRPITGAEVEERPIAEGRSGGAIIPHHRRFESEGGDGASGSGKRVHAAPGCIDRAVLLARDLTGYGNVCRVVSERMLDPEFDLVRAIGRDGRGLFVLVESEHLATALRSYLVPGALWMELPLWIGPRSLALRRESARRLGIGLVAGGAMSMGSGGEGPFQRVLAAIRTRGIVTEVTAADLASAEGYLRAPEEAAVLLREVPEALTNSRALAEACDVDLLRSKPIFPRYPLPEGETPYSYLYRLAHDGLRRRYGSEITPEITARLQRELETIHQMGFPAYFVVVGDLVRFARSRGIPVVGRGSGASSLVAYLLGITSVDPIAYRLYFERFLNSLRDDWPDLDVDLCWRGRDEVIEYAYETYGRDRVAMISTHNHYHCRSAFRDVARAFGVPTEVVDRVSKRIPRETEETLAACFARSKLLAEYPRDQEPYRGVLEIAERLRGAPRHLGIHCGGVVIGARPLARLTGLEEATKGIVVTQYEMHQIEQIGLIKIDLLGNRAISTIRETVALIKKTRGIEIDIENAPPDDPRTAELLCTGQTLGCFQVESPGMRNLLRMIGTKTMGKTIAAHSLIRPGPASSGMKERYVRRIRGIEPVSYGHPALEKAIGDLLEETLGIPLYQEDVMAVASRVTGISLEEGDLLRRRIGEARDEDSMRALTNSFLGLAVQRGVDIGLAKEAWRMIARFASYSFCKAHAAGYGVLAYQTAWLKAHHPVEHAVSLLNNHQGMYPTRVHLEEARRRGIEIRLPCVNQSGEEFTWERADEKPAGRTRSVSGDAIHDAAIRVGLGRVRDLSAVIRERIYDARPFRSLAQFLRRVMPPRRDAEHLVLVGAFDWTGTRRTELLWELYATYETRRKTWGRAKGVGIVPADGMAPTMVREALFDEATMFPGEEGGGESDRPMLNDMALQECLRYEMEILGLAVSAHPVALIRPTDGCAGCADSRVLGAGPAGRRITIVGIRDASRLVRTKKETVMLFLTLEDEHGLFECTLFPPVYTRFMQATRGAGPFRVTGRIEEHYGVRTITVERIESLGKEGGLLSDVLDSESM